jgi:hypothetical protein
LSARVSFQITSRCLRWVGVAALSLASACGEDFDPASELSGLRVLAVKKSSPYVRPGERIDLTMLWHDAVPGRPAPQIAWLALCENPPGDLFEACFAQPPPLSEEAIAARVSVPEPGATAPNDRFGFVTSADLISARPAPADESAIPYGLNYVFFAACAGQLELLTDGSSPIPFVCYEELDGVAGFSAGDNRRDSRDFIIGYTAVFAYEQIENDNPRFLGLEFGGATYWPDSPPEVAAAAPAGAVLAAPLDVCIGEGCDSAPPAPDATPCLEGLTVDACIDDECDGMRIEASVDPASAEVDAVASSRSATPLGEQMWINYYSTLGEVAEEVRLVNDAVAGFSEDMATDYQAPETPGATYVWAVAHDNRGGTEWARLRVCVR